MNKAFIDLSSDTATRPTPAMRRAIAEAEVGDEQRLEDPTVTRLLEAVCAKLHKEAALFLPSGTMCNLLAVKTHTNPGDTVFLGNNCHILRCETGAAAVASGVILDTVPAEDGCFNGEQLESVLFQPNPYTPVPRLVCVEQSHNFAGGKIWPLDALQEIQGVARKHNLAVHMDGARLFNASVASGVEIHRYAAACDSVWVDFTKGLGAPLGAVLCGSKEWIERARRYKHMFGGALRQAGMMAAGCLYALDNHVDRLAQDHEHAARLAACLSTLPSVEVRPVDTNLIFFKPGRFSLDEFDRRLVDKGVRMSRVGEWMRAATHLDVSTSDVEQAENVLRELL